MQAPADVTQVSAAQLAQGLAELWNDVLRHSGNEAFAVYAELDVTLTQVKALAVLAGCHETLSVKELAERLSLSLPGASRLAEALLRRGWLERREDPVDRRIRRLGITADGREVVSRIQGARRDALEAWAARLDPEQRIRLLHALPAPTPTEDPTP